MKKYLLAAAALLLAFALAGCSGENHKDSTEQSVGMEENAADLQEEAEPEPSSEEIETNSVYALVQGAEGNMLIVETEDGKVMRFDISRADCSPSNSFAPGDEVKVEFEGSEPIDGMAVSGVEVSAPFST